MPLLYEKRGAVAVLTLSRPQARNAWGEDYNAALLEMLPRLEDDPEIRVCRLDRRRGGRGVQRRRQHQGPEDAYQRFDRRRDRGVAEAAAAPGDEPVVGFRQAAGRRGQRLCRRHRLHRDLLLRPDRRLGAGRVAAAAGRARHLAGAGRHGAPRALGRPRPGDEGGDGVSAEGRGGLPHRARAMAGAARRADGEGDGGRRAHRRPAAAGGAAGQGSRSPSGWTRRCARRPTPISTASWRWN